MKKLLAFLVNPFVLPVIPSVIIILLLPFNYDRYLLEVAETKKLAQGVYEWFDDLTLDGNSERIYMRDNGVFTWVAIYDHKETLYHQWNFNGVVEGMGRPSFAISGDYNQCGQKELFFFTLKSDSIFLHSVKDLYNPDPSISNRFITLAGPGKGKPDLWLLEAEMQDLNGDGNKELIFGLGTGFSHFPRSVFAYYIDQDSLVRSPDSSYHINGLFQADITGDGQQEIIMRGMSSSNIDPSLARYHDHSNWLMVLDQNLEFLFEPVEIPGRSTSFVPLLIEKDGAYELKGLSLRGHFNENAVLYSFSQKGKITDTIDPGMNVSAFFVTQNRAGQPMVIFTNAREGTFVYDLSLNKLSPLSPINNLALLQHFDFDGNGAPEAVTLSLIESELHVFRAGMKKPATAAINWSTTVPLMFSVKESTTYPPQISLQLGQDHYLLSYGPNQAFYLNFLYFFLIYLGMLAFAFSSRRIQKKQIQRRYETEKKITELQLSLIKNQLDPHFTMNAINSIIHSVNNNESAKAHENLLRFSRLYRSMLLSADTTRRSLEDELNFCRDYLELEKARFDNAFDFEINIGKNVDLHKLVPKMMVQTHAENAVKHGLSAVPQDGKLNIDITSDGQQLEIEISDNGVGREQAAKKAGTSTGKGLAIMKEFFKLYKKYYKEDISADIQDIFDDQGKASGTRVIIKISQRDESN